MQVVHTVKTPTGKILVVRGDNGLLEMLSLADYGASVNLNQNAPVLDGTPLMPLSEKWAVTISTQYGCSMGCTFCDVPSVGPGINATLTDLIGQLETAYSLPEAPERTKRLNIHFARMGEPTWNDNVIECAKYAYGAFPADVVHPVVSTMCPQSNKRLATFLKEWMCVKNDLYKGNAGLQISVNSTDESERTRMFNGNATPLPQIAETLSNVRVVGRKITLNFVEAGFLVDCDFLAKLFDPAKFVVKITPMHKTHAANCNKITTAGDYTTPEPYKDLAERFRAAGFDTLVFIASAEEDASKITCGNAILSGFSKQ